MKIRIVNRKRFIISTSLLFFVLLTCGNVVMSAKPSTENISYEKIYVSKGKTLWEIAESEKENNKYYLNKDIRYIVYDLKRVNKLSNSSIREGQELYIPIIQY